VAYLGGGGIVPWPLLWLMGKFFEGLEGRWKAGGPPLDGSGLRIGEKVSKKKGSPSWSFS
jgi:hypothetical protein